MTDFKDYGILNIPEEVLSKITACPVDTAFKIVGRKFMILILRDLILFKKKKFSELLHSIPELNQKTLSIRLRELENGGFVRRSIYGDNPVREEYFITDKGAMLRPILEQMAAFSLSFCYEDVFRDRKRRSFVDIVGRAPSSL